MKILRTLLTLTFLGLPLWAQEDAADDQQVAPSIMNVVQWQMGPTQGDMGKEAMIEVPEGYMFLDGKNTTVLMGLFGNLSTEKERGLIAPVPADSNNLPWFVVFEFDKIGFVKDDDKDTLDPAAMLKAMEEGSEYGNKQRKKRGLETMHPVGWALEPNYNERSNNLEWAIKYRSEPSQAFVVNLNTRILGRKGVMEATLVVNPESLDRTIPEYQQVLTGYGYKEGQRYAEFRQGDNIAKLGLTGLVVGGGLAVAAKSGLLQKIFKPLIIALIALGAGVKKMFGFRSRDK